MLSVGTSALPEAPLILDSLPHKQEQIVQPQTGWVVLSEVPVCLHAAGHGLAGWLADRPSWGVQGWRWKGNTPSLRRFSTGMTSLFPQSFLNQWHQFLLICPKNMCEQGSLLFRQNFYLLFFHELYFFKRCWALPKNTWVELTTILILFGSSLVEHRYQKRQGFALLKVTWEGMISLRRLCSDVIIFPSSLDILMEEQIPEKIEFVKALDLNQ